MSTARASLKQRLFARFMSAMDEESTRILGPKREELLSTARGKIVELGPGTGVNFPYLPPGAEWVGIEPNPAMHPHLIEKANARGIAVDLRALDGDKLPLDDASVDFAISTLVLCSVPDVDAALAELHRVLVPGGKFLFMEHVAAPRGTFRRFVQRTMPYTPWRYCADGCNPGRELATNIENAGFAEVDIRPFDFELSNPIAWVVKPHIWGSATKAR